MFVQEPRTRITQLFCQTNYLLHSEVKQTLESNLTNIFIWFLFNQLHSKTLTSQHHSKTWNNDIAGKTIVKDTLQTIERNKMRENKR